MKRKQKELRGSSSRSRNGLKPLFDGQRHYFVAEINKFGSLLRDGQEELKTTICLGKVEHNQRFATDHVWVELKNTRGLDVMKEDLFLKKGVPVTFTAVVCKYQRGDGSEAFGLGDLKFETVGSRFIP